MTAKTPQAAVSSPAQDWARALERTASLARRPERIFPDVIDERAAECGCAPALLSSRECLTYAGLSARVNQYARWALHNGVRPGDCVGLLMSNRPEFLAIWLGITRVGGVAALLNTNLRGPSLAHCINVAAPKHVLVESELTGALAAALPAIESAPELWTHGSSAAPFNSFDEEVERYAGDALPAADRRVVTINDRALFIYTSGTTGLPKAASISHGRVMQWTHWFSGLMDTRSDDRLYNCLPMYHSVGGVQAPGSVLAAGGSVVLREKFSAGSFWSDLVAWDCTLFQYIGELCRYLLHTRPCPEETRHRIRMACGNGLRPDVWQAFQTRFRIARILEFYASTEGNVSLFNVEGEPGAIGRIPPYLAHRFPATLVQFDFETGEPLRDERGFCLRCAPNQPGEAIGQILGSANLGVRFEGYSCKAASEKKVLRDVFAPGDAWFRTGDLMRKDERGFYYFVDRIGDTFRWKGENVATSEIAEVICIFPGITEANVYGVAVPGGDGRAGMAAVVSREDVDLAALRAHLYQRLPNYAVPVFLRIATQMEVTATFKHTKSDLARQGYDPDAASGALYFNHPERKEFVPLDAALHRRIQSGEFPL